MTENPEHDMGMKVPEPPVDQIDLFQRDSRSAENLPPDTHAVPVADAAPVDVNVSAAAVKKPLIFTEHDPNPHRRGEETSRETKRTQPSIKRNPVHLDSQSFRPDCTFGDLLKAARQQAGMDLDSVAAATKLRVFYLNALENAKMDKLPPPVYVRAYVRTLCRLYLLDEESCKLVQEKYSSIPEEKKDVPASLLEDLEREGQVSEEEFRRIKRLTVIGIVVLCLLLAGVIWAIIAAVCSSSSSPEDVPASDSSSAVSAAQAPAGKPEFTLEEFDSLTVPQQTTSSRLKAGKKLTIAE